MGGDLGEWRRGLGGSKGGLVVGIVGIGIVVVVGLQ